MFVIYHKNCLDGFGAAWAFYQYAKITSKTVNYVAMQYGEPLPREIEEAIDFEIYLLDFSLSKESLQKLSDRGNRITVIDHHKTAEADLNDMLKAGKIAGIFNMEKSGAILTWEWFFDTPAPLLLQYIQDRDLWKFELVNSKEVNSALFSYPFDFTIWDTLSESVPDLIVEGKALERSFEKDVQSIIKRAHQFKLYLDNEIFIVPAVNCDPKYVSRVGEILSKTSKFAVMYTVLGERINLSFRSDKVLGTDVSMVAKGFNGGGHKNAAGGYCGINDLIWNYENNFMELLPMRFTYNS